MFLNQTEIKSIEKILISSVLQNEENFHYIKGEGITIDYFVTDSYKKLWSIIEENAITNGISLTILKNSFNDNPNQDTYKKREDYLNSLQNVSFTKDELFFAISKLKENYLTLKLSQIINETVGDLNKNSTADNILNSLVEKVFSLDTADNEIIEYDSGGAVNAVKKDLNDRTLGIIEDGIPSGIATLDEQIKCFYYSLFTIIIGRPGHGKTTLMLNCFLNNVLADYNPVFFSLEMPTVHLLVKMLSMMTKVKTNKIMSPKLLNADEKIKVKDALDELSRHNFYIVDAVSMNTTQCGRYLSKYVRKGCKIAYLDYIQLLKLSNNKIPVEAGEFRQISKDIREILRKVNRQGEMALVVGAQAGRTVESRNIEDRIPTQRDLEWTSALEQDASTIIGIMNREKYEGEDCEFKNQLFLGFPKHRYDNAKKINLAFLADIQFITDLCEDQAFIDRINAWDKEIDKKNAELKQKKEDKKQNH